MRVDDGRFVQETVRRCFAKLQWDLMALVRVCGKVRSPTNYSARGVLHAQERNGEDHDPEQEHAQVDALPHAYPRRREIGGDPGASRNVNPSPHQVTMDIGSRALKLASYRAVMRPFALPFAGFKLFYRQDTNLFAPADVMRLAPDPFQVSLSVIVFGLAVRADPVCTIGSAPSRVTKQGATKKSRPAETRRDRRCGLAIWCMCHLESIQAK